MNAGGNSTFAERLAARGAPPPGGLRSRRYVTIIEGGTNVREVDLEGGSTVAEVVVTNAPLVSGA